MGCSGGEAWTLATKARASSSPIPPRVSRATARSNMRFLIASIRARSACGALSATASSIDPAGRRALVAALSALEAVSDQSASYPQPRRQPIGNGQTLSVRLPDEVERVDADQQRVGLSAEDAGDVAPALGPLREADCIAPRGPTPVRVVVLYLEADVVEALVEPRLVVLRDRLPADDDRRRAAEDGILGEERPDRLGVLAGVGFGEPPEEGVDGLPVVARLGTRRRDAADDPGGDRQRESTSEHGFLPVVTQRLA